LRPIVVVDDGSPSVARARKTILLQNISLFVAAEQVGEHTFSPSTTFITPVGNAGCVAPSEAGACIAYGSADDMERAFLLGVDDYLCEPWTGRELLVRARRLTRYDSSPLGHVVQVGGDTVVFSDVQAVIWSVLSSRPGRVVNRRDLAALAGVNGDTNSDPNGAKDSASRAIDMHIHRIRHVLGTQRDRIETVRGCGYRLVPEKVNYSNPIVDK